MIHYLIIIFISLLFGKYIFYSVEHQQKYKKIIRNGNILHILKTETSNDAVLLLESIAHDAEKLVDHVSKKYPQHSGMQLLRKRFNKDNLYEGSPRDKDFTYTEDKGTKIVICLRNKKMNFHDKNLLMFPVIHELGHMCDKEHNPGHGGEFTNCFKFLLQEAIKIGIYQPIDFINDPKPYCGMVISSNPL